MFSKFLCGISLVAILCFSLLGTTTAQEADDSAKAQWGHWRGEDGNGVSTTATPPIKWSDTENVKWKVAVPGRGSGSPVIWNDRVFVVTAVANDGAAIQQQPQGGQRRRGGGGGAVSKNSFQLICYNRKTGEELWQQTAIETTPHQGVHQTNSFASASPCTDGEHVYAFFGSQGLYCYTMDGKLVWEKKDFGKLMPRASFGEGASPTLAGDKIIVPWDHEGPSALYALNKLTGETIWKVDRNDEPTNWATPLIVEHNGVSQVVMNGQTYARGYDLNSGQELWRCSGQTNRPCASPVAADGMVFVTSGFRGSFLGAFNLDGRGDLSNSGGVAWSMQRNTPDIPSPLLSEGRLYFYKARAGILSCVDAKTGQSYFAAVRVPGLSDIYASPVAAGGHIYLSDRRGKTVVIKDAPKFEVVASNSLGETIDATPAPVGDELFIRGEKHLFCIAK